MNTQIQKLFDKYNLSPKTRHDLAQIYNLLPVEKQKNILHNFEIIACKIQYIEESMKKEQEILLDRIIPDITMIILNDKKQEVKTKILSSVI